ncbi:hypothetical protein [Archangium sp.]|uniref:hypothetical protein n=1 Tax=Archangium sp. TaxID=1872627 RepID=UPI002D2DEBFE|nr:hypothetical protein [Archangium sp.]HYO52881.1 hypothetical protein [Archangium sp.]
MMKFLKAKASAAADGTDAVEGGASAGIPAVPGHAMEPRMRPGSSRSRSSFATLAVVTLGAGLVAAPVTSAIAGPANLVGRDVELAFSEGQPVGHVFPAGTMFTHTGTAGSGVVATALYANGGVLKVAAGRGTGNLAVAAPAHISTATGTPKSAVIRVSNAGTTDHLDPGTGNFSFGADFALNTASATAGSKDDGDNLIQRGLASSATQYKIQIDGGKPSCVLRQQTTTLTAKATQVIERNMWYRAVCNRTTTGGETTVTLTVTRLGDGTAVPAQAGTGPALDLSIATTVPLSLGGKLNDSGTLVLSSTDQFNGRIDNAFLDLP